ncbi:MAG: hypothetical protein OEZ23_08090 [Gammaproteobacteria bacterium]|nr:hypothetical protein [Gammaproteobacteria bacterium]
MCLCLILLVLGGIARFTGRHPVDALIYFLSADPGSTVPDSSLQDRPVSGAVWKGNLANPDLDELSGYVSSSRYQNIFYGINDSGGDAVIFVMDESGADIGEVNIGLPKPRDWEDLVSFRHNGEDYLLIAETGDNLHWHDKSWLHLVREPKMIRQGGQWVLGTGRSLPVLQSIAFRFPDGPRDCEAVAYDETTQSVFLISKHPVPAEVFRLSVGNRLSAAGLPGRDTRSMGDNTVSETVLVAEKIALLTGIPQPTEQDLREDPDYGQYRSRVTAMDMKNNRAVVLTYKHAYLYERHDNLDWEDVFKGVPERIPLPPYFGREAAALTVDSRWLYVSGERFKGRGAQPIFATEL